MKGPVLVVAAHPDDEVLGCGGTIHKMSSADIDVVIAILGEGLTSRNVVSDSIDSDVEKLHMISKEVGRRMGAKNVVTFKYPDNKFDSIPLLDYVKTVEQLIHNYNPATIFTHHYSDLNIDHAIVSRAVLTASRPVPGSSVEELYAFEVASSTEWSFGHLNSQFKCNTYIDIGDSLKVKLDAYKMYRGEIRDYPHARSADAIKHMARLHGCAVGCVAAERFELIRSVKSLL